MDKHAGKTLANTLLIVGTVGITIAFALNLISAYWLQQPAAEFFVDEWWSSWFPAYLCWIAFLLMGTGFSVKRNTDHTYNTH